MILLMSEIFCEISFVENILKSQYAKSSKYYGFYENMKELGCLHYNLCYR